MNGIDQGPSKHRHAGAKLAEAGGIEETSSSHCVELEHEQDEGQTAENEGEHHEDLHRLQPAILADVTAGPRFGVIVPRAVVPEIQGLFPRESPPGLVQSGHKKQDENEDVKG